jgi:nucleotide-binding universal stress UspA family protein
MSQENFTNIVIPFDNSASSRVALRTAVNIAGRFLSNLNFVHVKPEKSTSEKLTDIEEVMEKINQKTGLSTKLFTPIGRIEREVTRISESLNADLIVMGTHGTKGFQELWMGSNAFRVVSSSSIPVITMQESYPKEGFEKILIPMDDSIESRQKIPMTIQMAKNFNSDVTVLGTSKYEDDETIKKVKAYVDQTIGLLEAEGVHVSGDYHFGGNIADSTLSYAKGAGTDLIIMMSESEPSSGLFIGTNAQRMVNHSPIPLLTIHAKEVTRQVVGY